MQSSRSDRIQSTPRGRHVLAGLAAMIGGLHANVARADWGENWGEMTWGVTSTPVPMLDGWGLLLLSAGLLAVATLTIAKRRGARMTLVILVSLAVPLAAYAATISLPNIFSNGTTADANEVNANFDTLVLESNAQDTRLSTLEATDITGITAGSGLTGGGTSGGVSLGVDSGYVQRRVGSTCPVGQSIRAIDSVGGVTCEVDDVGLGDITGVTAGSGLIGGGSGGSVQLSVGIGAITETHLASNSVAAAEIVANAVGTSEILDGSVGATDVDSTEVRIDWSAQLAHAACSSYTLDTDMTRETGYYDGSSNQCDSGIGTAWTRFTDGGSYDRMMSTTMPARYGCDTDAPGYMVGEHPAVEDGEVTRKVCFHWSSNSCLWNQDIQVVNCGSYYVYELVNAPSCSLRYCTEPVHASKPIIGKFYPTSTDVGSGNWNWDASAINTSTLHFTRNADNITIGIAGFYQVCQKLMYSGATVGATVRTYLNVNGSTMHDSFHLAVSDYDQDAYCTILEFAVGDIVTFYNTQSGINRFGDSLSNQGRYSHVTFMMVK
jgi:hypothetical protein